MVVDEVVEQRGEEVADEGGEEDEGDDGVADAVVGFDLTGEVSWLVAIMPVGGNIRMGVVPVMESQQGEPVGASGRK